MSAPKIFKVVFTLPRMASFEKFAASDAGIATRAAVVFGLGGAGWTWVCDGLTEHGLGPVFARRGGVYTTVTTVGLICTKWGAANSFLPAMTGLAAGLFWGSYLLSSKTPKRGKDDDDDDDNYP